MATEQDQPDHGQGSDHSRSARVTGGTRRDAAQRCAHIPADRVRQAVRVGGGVWQQVCRLVRRRQGWSRSSATTARRATIGRTVCARRRACNSHMPDAQRPEIMAVSGHATLSEVQKYVNAVEQDRMAEAAMDKRAAGSKRAQVVTDDRRKAMTEGTENIQEFGWVAPRRGRRKLRDVNNFGSSKRNRSSPCVFGVFHAHSQTPFAPLGRACGIEGFSSDVAWNIGVSDARHEGRDGGTAAQTKQRRTGGVKWYCFSTRTCYARAADLDCGSEDR